MYYEQTIDDKFNAMVDSVNLIEQIICTGIRSLNNYETIDRNYRHLEAMCAQEDIIEDGRDLTPFEAVIAAGREFTGLN